MPDPIRPISNELIKEIFARARELPESERAAFLDAQCASDVSARAAVESLLRADESAGEFLAGPTAGGQSLAEAERAGRIPSQQIGPYKLLQIIGEGGFGTVYLAEQQHPVRRRVALKLIKAGMDTHEAIARFEAERQALALMEHPNIAKVFGAGATEAGRPYFVMELVKGVPITTYCDTERLSINDRLRLFIQVCQAIQHAHQKGVIHRDVKPSNVLIIKGDSGPVAKVIDFGVAKATQARLTEKTLFTEFRQMIGTPEYMSPEQADTGAVDVDTRSDIYSLGVLLYELLTGAPPFDPRELRAKAYEEIQRIIREVDPPRPSTRLLTGGRVASVAAVRGIDPARLRRSVRGELDWIVMKCLEKERSRRYDSASHLTADLLHHLAGEPVSAGPAGTMYRLRKLARKHRTLVIASSAVLLALVLGIIGTTVGLIRESRQRALAETHRIEAERQAAEAKTQAAISNAIQEFQSDMLASADPDRLLGDKVTVLQAMTSAIKELNEGKLKDQPAVEAAVRVTIGATLRELGRYDAAESELKKALELRRAQIPRDDKALGIALVNLGLNYYHQGRFDAAEPLYLEAIQIERASTREGPKELATDLNNLAMLYSAQGKYAQARPLFDEALSIYRGLEPADDKLVSIGLNNVALLLEGQGKPADAEPLYREALAIDRRSHPPGHPSIATKLCNLAGVLETLGKYDEAETLAREGLAIFRQSLPAGHTNIAKALIMVAVPVGAKGDLQEAERLHRESLAIHRAALPPDHPDIVTSVLNVAQITRRRNDLPEAERLFREAVAMYQRTHPPDHVDIAEARTSLASLLLDSGKPGEAESILRETVTVLDRAVGAQTNGASRARFFWGLALLELRRFSEAESALLQAYDAMSVAQGIPANRKTRCIRALAKLYMLLNEVEPGKSYDAKSAEWSARLPATQPASGPTTRP